MTWGNDFWAWLASDDGWRVLSGAVIPAVAIVTAGIVAALIGRGATRRLIALHRQDALAAAISGFMLAGRKSARWHELTEVERAQLEHLAAESETRIRLLPIAGSVLAATWASHQLESMKRDSSGFRFQAQQTLAEYRDRLVAWSEKPRSAKKLFGADLERWSFEVAGDAPTSPSVVPSTSAIPAPSVASAEWVSSPGALDDLPLTPEPPTSVVAHTGTMPLIITQPRPASTVRDRLVPGSA